MPALARFDHAMQTFMQANARPRRTADDRQERRATKLARAYTWAEPGYRITQPSDRFLLASCSKMFLEAAVQALYDAHKLQPTTKVSPAPWLPSIRPIRAATRSRSSNCATIRAAMTTPRPVSGFDPTYAMRKIALDEHLDHKVDKLDVCRYMYVRQLDFTPGTNNKYSNFGYLLASAVVEKVTGIDYFKYVHDTLLQSAGITEVEVRPTAANQQPPTEAMIEDQGLG